MLLIYLVIELSMHPSVGGAIHIDNHVDPNAFKIGRVPYWPDWIFRY